MPRLLLVFAVACLACASSGSTGSGTKASKEPTKVLLLDGTSMTVEKVEVVELIPEGRLGFTFVLGTPLPIDQPIPLRLTLPEGECALSLASVTRIGPGSKGKRAAEYAVTGAEGCALKPNLTYDSSLGKVKRGDSPERLRPAGF